MSICSGVLEFCGYGGYQKEKKRKKENPQVHKVGCQYKQPFGIHSTSLRLSKKLLQSKSFTIYSKVCYVENLTYYENGRWEKLLEPSSLHQHIKFLTNPSSTSRCSFCTSTFITIYQYDQSNLITFEIGIWNFGGLGGCPNIVQIISCLQRKETHCSLDEFRVLGPCYSRISTPDAIMSNTKWGQLT